MSKELLLWLYSYYIDTMHALRFVGRASDEILCFHWRICVYGNWHNTTDCVCSFHVSYVRDTTYTTSTYFNPWLPCPTLSAASTPPTPIPPLQRHR
jgi:hypothetical protein